MLAVGGAAVHAEAYRQAFTCSEKKFLVGCGVAFLARGSELIDMLDRVPSQFLRARLIKRQLTAVEIAGGNSAKRDDSSHRSNGVGTAAEAEEKNPVLGLGEPDNRCIAVNYVLGDA